MSLNNYLAVKVDDIEIFITINEKVIDWNTALDNIREYDIQVIRLSEDDRKANKADWRERDWTKEIEDQIEDQDE